MIKLLLIIFILLWLTGFIHLPVLNSMIFSFSSHSFTLYNLILLIFILWIISLLPGIFRTIAIILFILWLLSNLGLFIFSGLPHIIIILLILVVIFSFI